MKYLLDTQIFLWMTDNPDLLSEKVKGILEDNSNLLFLSIASIWEMQIKISLNKLEISMPLKQLVEEEKSNNIKILQIKQEHIWNLDSLQNHHKDPFDRLLISQSIVENIQMISKDETFKKYLPEVISE